MHGHTFVLVGDHGMPLKTAKGLRLGAYHSNKETHARAHTHTQTKHTHTHTYTHTQAYTQTHGNIIREDVDAW